MSADSSDVPGLLHLQLSALRPADPPHYLDLLHRQDSLQGTEQALLTVKVGRCQEMVYSSQLNNKNVFR